MAATAGYDNGSLQRGNGMDVPWRANSTVGYGSVYGASGGQAVAERAANVVNMRRVMNPGMGSGSSALTIPVILVIAGLAWYALRNYE